MELPKELIDKMKNMKSLTPEEYAEKSKRQREEYELRTRPPLPRVDLGLTIKFKNFNKKLHENDLIKSLNNLDDNIDVVYIYGIYSNGKTFACQNYIYKNCTPSYDKDYCTGIYYTLSDFLMELYARSFEERVNFIKRLKSYYKILVIDEIDKIKLTDWKEEMIFNLLDGRINNMLLTILVSNKEPKQLIDILGKNIVSRVLAEAQIIENKGKALR